MSSGRLQGFVKRTGRSDSPLNIDRKTAQSLKFFARQPPPVVQEYASITRHTEHQALGLDSTVGSDFDHTKSEIASHEVFDLPQSARLEEEDHLKERENWEQDQEQSKYNLHRNVQGPKRFSDLNMARNEIQYAAAGRYAVPQENAPIRVSKIGRFQSLETVNLEMREGPTGNPNDLEDYVSGKRPHSEQGDSDVDRFEEVDDDLNSEVLTRNSTPSRPRNLRTIKNAHNLTAESHVTYPEVDYNDETLKKMKYVELETQSWEDIPNRKAFSLPRELRGTRVTLEAKMNYYLAAANKDKATTGPARAAAEAFYEQLSSKEWDQAGEIFIEKFTGLMQKLQAKRREKRQIVDQFEKEVHEREKVVRGHLERLDKKLGDMRTSGESLLVG